MLNLVEDIIQCYSKNPVRILKEKENPVLYKNQQLHTKMLIRTHKMPQKISKISTVHPSIGRHANSDIAAKLNFKNTRKCG